MVWHWPFSERVFKLLTVRRATTHGQPSTTLNNSHAYKKSSPHAILNRFADDLALLPLQPRSQQSYWACVRQLSEHFDRSPDLLSAEELRQYFIHLKNERRFARQSSTQALCSIKLFWENTLQRRWPAELELARELWRTHHHPRLLFPAKGHSGLGAPTANEPMCRSTLQRAFRLALRASGVKKDAQVHTLRQNAE